VGPQGLPPETAEVKEEAEVSKGVFFPFFTVFSVFSSFLCHCFPLFWDGPGGGRVSYRRPPAGCERVAADGEQERTVHNIVMIQ